MLVRPWPSSVPQFTPCWLGAPIRKLVGCRRHADGARHAAHHTHPEAFVAAAEHDSGTARADVDRGPALAARTVDALLGIAV